MSERLSHLVPVAVEVLLLRLDEARVWRYRRLVVAMEKGETPDHAVRRSCGVAAGDPATVVHSTSWRYQPGGQIVLTYAVCPDPDPELPAMELTDLRLARGASPATPTPDDVQVENVIAHALRHLAHLQRTDPVVGAALSGDAALARELECLPADPAREFFASAV